MSLTYVKYFDLINLYYFVNLYTCFNSFGLWLLIELSTHPLFSLKFQIMKNNKFWDFCKECMLEWRLGIFEIR